VPVHARCVEEREPRAQDALRDVLGRQRVFDYGLESPKERPIKKLRVVRAATIRLSESSSSKN